MTSITRRYRELQRRRRFERTCGEIALAVIAMALIVLILSQGGPLP